MQLTTLDWTTIAAYFGVIFFIGFFFARKKKTASDYFLGGRHALFFVVGCSIFAANISSEHLLGLAGSGAAGGLTIGTFELAAVFCIMVLGWVFLPFYLKGGFFTMPEYMENRFNPECRWTLTAISIFAYVFTKISVALFAGSILIKTIIGWSIMKSAVFLVIATGIYTVAGGLGAIMYTELLQTIILIAGSAILTVIGLDKVGGFAGLREALPPEFFHIVKPANDPGLPWTGTTIGIFLLGVWYWCSDQVIVQRTLGGKNLTHSRGGTILTAWLKLLPIFIFVLPGLIAAVLWPEEIAADPDIAYPLIVKNLLPQGATGLMIAALLAALMSSLGAVFNSCSTLITMDIYKKFKPLAAEKTLVTVGRISTIAIVVISLIWIPMIRFLSKQLYMYLQSIQAYIGAPIASVFLVGIFWKRATGKAAFTTMVVGGLCGLVRLIGDIVEKTEAESLAVAREFFISLKHATGYAFLNYCIFMFVCCVVLMVIISLVTKKPRPEQVDGMIFSFKSATEGSSRKWTWIHAAMSILVVILTISLWAHFA